MNAEQPKRKVFVSDFDGTMTRHDFYELAIESLLPADVPNYWTDYRAGVITHFEALRRYFAAIRAPEAEVLAVVRRMELDPRLASSIETLRQAGWQIVVTSAGCEWYIRRLLGDAGVDLEVHANRGRYDSQRGLVMEMPTDSPFWSPNLGVNKSGVVQKYLNEGWIVAFAGDGFPDAGPARLVEHDLRFARRDLAAVLTKENLPYHSFETWSEIATRLLQGSS